MDTHEILDCNQSVKAVYGYTKDEIIKKSFLDLFIDQEKSYYAFKITTSAYIKEAKHITKDGEIFPVAIRVSPSEYPGQKVLLVTTSDITKRLEAEQQLMHAGKMATLGEMATGVAHELNQPLQVIKTASSYCMKKLNENTYIDDEILCDMLEKIDRNVNRSTKIIYYMREFARKSDTVLAPVQVNEVLEKAFENFNQQFKLIGIEVAWNIENNPDPDRLEQIFTNLFLNAKDAIEKKWEHQEHAEGGKKIKLKTKFAKNKVFVEFCDTGTGIPAEIADKIFEPFFTTKEVGKGTGLGLSISYGIVKECGGDIQMTSNKDEGACFSITFPIQDIE
ncbi:MAG: PAS domain S-box protein [Deltaproteobacteria bacterium]|nr:PAS domain S-box protein [Deltaproteobacteria bacterium]